MRKSLIVPFFRHGLTGSDVAKISRVLNSHVLTAGPIGEEVSSQLREFFQIPFATLSNSWTNAAIACLQALDIGGGDEVIVPAQTFVATANVVEMVGARPVFVDVDSETLLMTPAALKHALNARVRAVIPVHLYGQMCDVEGIRRIVGNDVAIIEDAAHCFEGHREGNPPGTFSEAAIFSFYATKNITCGEGGAIISRHEALFEKIHQAMLAGISPRGRMVTERSESQQWSMVRLGGKAVLSDINAALLGDQIGNVRSLLPLREALASRYEAAFRGTQLHFPRQDPGVLNARHLFPVWVDPAVRELSLNLLREKGIGVTINYRAVTDQPYYSDKYGFSGRDFPVSSKWGRGTFSLPLYPSLSGQEQDYIISVLLEDILPLIRN